MANRLQQVGRDERWQLRTRQHVGGADARIVRPRNEDKVRVLGKGRRLRQQLRELPKVGGAGMGVVDKPETGPYFGPEGLTIPLFSKSPRRARCKLGPYYQRMPSGGNSMFEGGEGEVALSRLQVFVGDWGGEPIPFDDAIPFSLT